MMRQIVLVTGFLLNIMPLVLLTAGQDEILGNALDALKNSQYLVARTTILSNIALFSNNPEIHILLAKTYQAGTNNVLFTEGMDLLKAESHYKEATRLFLKGAEHFVTLASKNLRKNETTTFSHVTSTKQQESYTS